MIARKSTPTFQLEQKIFETLKSSKLFPETCRVDKRRTKKHKGRIIVQTDIQKVRWHRGYSENYVAKVILRVKSLHHAIQSVEVNDSLTQWTVYLGEEYRKLRKPRKVNNTLTSICSNCTQPVKISDNVEIPKFATTSLGRKFEILSIGERVIRVRCLETKKTSSIPKASLIGTIIYLNK